MKSSFDCFFLKDDFLDFLDETENEYIDPQQEYVNFQNRKDLFENLKTNIRGISSDKLNFNAFRTKVNPPRVYINSNSEYYTLMRKLGIPNLSYLSVMKLKKDGNISYYFKIFTDHKYDIEKKYMSKKEKEEVEKIDSSPNKTVRQRNTIIEARIGQGKFRDKLLLECVFCPFTHVNDERILIASHIKPWSQSNDREKIDPKNGFIFTATYDSLFDKGFITFSDDKKLIVSNWISPINQKRLKIYTGQKIERLPLDDKRLIYLKYHRDNIFKS